METHFELAMSEALGSLMTQTQTDFYLAAILFCPEQLTARPLHAILIDPELQFFEYGSKGGMSISPISIIVAVHNLILMVAQLRTAFLIATQSAVMVMESCGVRGS